jgi:hypothetical protein
MHVFPPTLVIAFKIYLIASENLASNHTMLTDITNDGYQVLFAVSSKMLNDHTNYSNHGMTYLPVHRRWSLLGQD